MRVFGYPMAVLPVRRRTARNATLAGGEPGSLVGAWKVYAAQELGVCHLVPPNRFSWGHPCRGDAMSGATER